MNGNTIPTILGGVSLTSVILLGYWGGGLASKVETNEKGREKVENVIDDVKDQIHVLDKKVDKNTLTLEQQNRLLEKIAEKLGVVQP